jgi:hypothetical protein
MKKQNLKLLAFAVSTLLLSGCGDEALSNNPGANDGSGSVVLAPQPKPTQQPTARNGDALLGNPQYPAISYGAWRSNVRESGDKVPSVAQQIEDMKILSALGIKVIRTYNTQGFIGTDGKSNTENLLEAISQLKQQDPNFEMYVMLGIWIDALNSWTNLTVEHDKDNPKNFDEIAKAKELALKYPDIVKVLAVGNEAMVDWAPYHVTPQIILNHVEDLQQWKLGSESTKDIWVTSSDNYAVWSGQDANGNQSEQAVLKALIKAVDYVSLHTYALHDTHYHPDFSQQWKVPQSEQNLSKQEQIDSAMDRAYQHTLGQIQVAQSFINRVDAMKPIHLGETGWSSISTDGLGAGGTQAADEYKQKRFYDDMRAWSDQFGASLFFFKLLMSHGKGMPTTHHIRKSTLGLLISIVP